MSPERELGRLLDRGAEGIILINADPPDILIDVPLNTGGAGFSQVGSSTIAIDKDRFYLTRDVLPPDNATLVTSVASVCKARVRKITTLSRRIPSWY